MSSLRDPLYIPVMLPRARRTDSIRVSAVFHVSRCLSGLFGPYGVLKAWIFGLMVPLPWTRHTSATWEDRGKHQRV